jgi:hypothetical protein
MGKLMIFFMHTCADFFSFMLFKRSHQGLLIFRGEDLIGHREKDFVLFIDMAPEMLIQDGQINRHRLCGCGVTLPDPDQSFGDGLYRIAAAHMLMQHDGYRAFISRNATFLHGGEKVFLLFAVVAAIHKHPEKIQDFV